MIRFEICIARPAKVRENRTFKNAVTEVYRCVLPRGKVVVVVKLSESRLRLTCLAVEKRCKTNGDIIYADSV